MRRSDYFNTEEDDYDFNDDDSLLNINQWQGEEVKAWDQCKIIHRKPDVGSVAEDKFIDNGVKILKICTIITVFLVVLGSAVLSKGTLLLMTSQIKKNITRSYCNEQIDPNRNYTFSIPETERVTWIWYLMLAYFVPEAGTFFRSVRILLFKTWDYPKFTEFAFYFVTEILSAIGSSLLVFHILPEMDVIRGAMLTNAMCFIPAIGFQFRKKKFNKENMFTCVIDVAALVAQASAFLVWPLTETILENPNMNVFWLIPMSLTLISFGWWENFVYEESQIQFIRDLAKGRKHFPHSKYFCYSIISVIKCIAFFTTAVASFSRRGEDPSFIFNSIKQAFSNHVMNITEVWILPNIDGTSNIGDAVDTGTHYTIFSNVDIQLIIWILNISFTYICYAFGKFACKIMIQGAGFAFPIGLTVPSLISALVLVCGYYSKDICAFTNVLPPYLFFKSPPLIYLQDFVGHYHVWIWLFWLLSQIWITKHIWINHNSKLASTEQIFMRPMYDAFFIDQSLAMNRRNVADELIKHKANALGDGEVTEVDEDKITRIYACGTMWHETHDEMMEFLKSIMRMDEDQASHRIVRQYLQYPVEGYYEWETHIFFDDAFVRKSKEDNDPNLNEYVQDLVACVGEAASEVHKTTVRIRPPVIYPTPYGGRLVWTLPGKTKMIAHLKDKAKIRAKKRWSQVMYMYYLLGHRILDNEEFTPERCKIRSKNTYILALDGDIDFQPEAVQLLVQYMKKKDNLGAACGRIHPIGAGAIAWYQVFEYAVGHWMQKATEHVIGCVLCSPGCFSLFRASALMDHNVMARYTTRSGEARHYVQYDQGEDRWLCTLLLQRGYRVEYSAASDAYTHCPEGFNEFYNQRRRWMPSTMANILDLLQDSKHIIKINDDISRFYIFYQVILMIGTVIGPGTIFLMLVGAFVTAFKLSQWSAFTYNLIPIAIFVAVCILCKSDTQLTVAAAISAFYGLVMLAVIIGIVLQIHDDGILAPSSLFFLLMIGEFVVAAIIHPKEVYCLKYGVIYFVTVPSMYMLLVIYSVFNMNNVSWGTREVTVVKTAENGEEAPKQPEKPKHSMVVSWLFAIRDFFTGCCKQESGTLVMINNSLRNIEQKVEYLERITLEPDVINDPIKMKRKTTIMEGARASKHSILTSRQSSRPSNIKSSLNIQEEEEDDDSIGTPSDDLQNNSWFYNGDLIRGHVTFLEKKEEVFWKELLDKYLHPIEDDKVKVARDLKDLRDKMVMSFFMINALFVLTFFLLTQKKNIIHINWPFNPKVNFTYIGASYVNEIIVSKTYLQLEPIGFVFLIFFFMLMAIQFICMFIHRFGTYCQIMANTDLDLNLFETKIENLTEDEILERNPIKIFKRLIKLKGVNGDDEKDEEAHNHVSRRNTVAALIKNKDKKRAIVNDLDAAFAIRMAKIRAGEESDVPLPRKTLAAINRRRTTILKRKSQMFPNNPQAYSSNDYQQDLSRINSSSNLSNKIHTFENPAFVGDEDQNETTF